MASFKFLVTTDNHMGFKFEDRVRRKDSFMAFAETLQIAREKDVDFVLLGGDLFHTNKPNALIEHKCIKILRQHMQAAAKTTTFRRVSGQFSHFERLKHGNFEDPSLSVPYPILTIHGNHDDPTGPAHRSICEKLATCGLLNYFGKIKQTRNEKELHIEPIVLEKGPIKIALYGIGFISDKKLCAAFRLGYITFEQPKPDTFNILVVHQNRRKYDDDKYIPDKVFPKWFHLIIRGHEHDALLPEKFPESDVDGIVYQPGSTVATSIEMREAGPKQCGLMTVELKDGSGDEKDRYKLSYDIIELRCYRRILFKDVYQKEVFDHIKQSDTRRKMTPIEYRNIFRKFVIGKIDTMLEEYKQNNPDLVDGPSDPASPSSQAVKSSTQNVYNKLFRFKLPLVRIRLEYVNKSEIFDDTEVNVMFNPTLTANRDIIKFRRQKVVQQADGRKVNLTFSDDIVEDSLEDIEDEIGEVETIDLSEERKDTIDTMILNYFENKEAKDRLAAISLDEYTEAVNGATEGGNIIAKVLSKKRNAVQLQYKTAIKDDETAKLHFSQESRIHDWFVATFKGQQPRLAPVDGEPDEDWDDDEADNDAVIMLD